MVTPVVVENTPVTFMPNEGSEEEKSVENENPQNQMNQLITEFKQKHKTKYFYEDSRFPIAKMV